MQQVPHSLPYNKALDGIRGIAVILVVLFHLWPEYFSFGFVGVDIFFVLSGYLITKIIVTKSERGKFSLYEFYRNRIRRIFPALIIVLSVSLIVGYLFLFPEEFKQLGDHIKSSALFYQNFRLIDEAGYWDESGQLKPLLHFWSLSIEEQFYVFWPFVIIVLARLKALHALPLIFLSLLYISFEIEGEASGFFHSFARFWELSVGATLVWLERFSSAKWFTEKIKHVIFVLFVIAIALFYQEGSYVLLKTSFLVLTVGLLILSLHSHDDTFLGQNWIVFIGLISYPLYLWHYPIISYAHILGVSVVENGAWIFIISIVLSYLTYRYVEVYARKQTDIKVIASLFAAVIVLAGVGGVIKSQDGFPDRPHLSSVKEAQLQFIREPAVNNNCEKISAQLVGSQRTFNYCKSTSPLITGNYVAIIGDSHAHVLYPGFSEALKAKGYDTLLLANSGCASLLGGGRGRNIAEVKECEAKIAQIYSVVLAMPNLAKIVLVARGPKYMYEKGFGEIDKTGEHKYAAYFSKDEKYKPESIYMKSMDENLSYLTGHGKEVYVFLENPELGFSPKSCVLRPFGLASRPCAVAYSDYKQRMQSYRSSIMKIAAKYANVHILDPEPLLCDDENCYARIEGEMLYADDDHFSVKGSRYIANQMISKLVK